MRQKNKTIRGILALALCGISFIFTQKVFAQSTIDVIIHYVSGVVDQEEYAYRVKAFVSVLDSAGNPIKDLDETHFSISEDGQTMVVDAASLVEDEPIDLVLVLDTSGSMFGLKLDAAKEAAVNFINALSPEDGIAVMSFNEEISTHINLTLDHQAVIDEVSLINAELESGTCLNDAAYEAVQLASAFQSGKRAVLLLTDGVDELPDGSVCSLFRLDDVINLASAGIARVPVYTIGLGNRIDEESLMRLSTLTGGRYFYSPDESQLEALFNRLFDQLKSQYVVTYTSHAGPGSHVFVVNVEYLGAADLDTRNFLLPELPPQINILSPAGGEEVRGEVTIMVSARGDVDQINQFTILIDDELVDVPDLLLSGYVFDFNELDPGTKTIAAIAYDEEGVEISRDSITVIIPIVEPTLPSPTATIPPPTPVVEEEQVAPVRFPYLWVILGGIVLAGAVVYFWFRSRETPAAASIQERVSPYVTVGRGEAVYAYLTILHSDDELMIGQTIEISKSPIRLGRRATNDIIFAQDMPVSREHVVIENTPEGISLTEISTTGEDGERKRPRYGTFVNEEKVGVDSVFLDNEDEIRLGSRVRLKFETFAGRMMAEELLTYDEVMLPGSGTEDTRTMETDQARENGEDEDGTREMPSE